MVNHVAVSGGFTALKHRYSCALLSRWGRVVRVLIYLLISSCSAFAVQAQAQEPEPPADGVYATSLTIDAPLVLSPFDLPGTTIQLEVVLFEQPVLGIGTGSAVASLVDDRGKDLLQEERDRLPEIDLYFEEMFGMTAGERRDTGHIIHDEVSAETDWGFITVPVRTLGLPSSDATTLTIEGTLEVLMVGEDERAVQMEHLQYVSLDPDRSNYFSVEGEQVTCLRDAYDASTDVSEWYCYGPGRVKRVEVVGQEDTPPPSANDRVNLVVIGPTENLELSFIYPVPDVTELPFALKLGLGL